MSDSMDRRCFLGVAAVAGLATGLASEATGAQASPNAAGDSSPRSRPGRPILTEASEFVDVSRGNPEPSTLKGEALSKARLTAGTWRLEIVGDDSSEIARPSRLEDGSASTSPGSRSWGRPTVFAT